MNPIEYDRVTEILSPYTGLDKIDPEVLQRASERGKEVHDLCGLITSGFGDFKVAEEYSGYMESFLIWIDGKSFLKTPGRLYCDQLKITGEIDGLYKDDRGLVLFDLKTSASEGKTWHLQGAAYAYLLRKQGYDIQAIEFVKLSKEGKKPKIYLYEENFNLFLSCLDIYRTFFKGKRLQLDSKDI